MAAQDELTLLAGELARKIEGTKTCQVFARGVPGITHETFTSEAAVRALMTCERLFEVDDEEKSPQRRKRVSLLPNKLVEAPECLNIRISECPRAGRSVTPTK